MEQFEHYKIIERYNLSDLANTVNKMVKDGWIPAGGLCPHRNNLYQAMWFPPIPDEIKIHMQNALVSKDTK